VTDLQDRIRAGMAQLAAARTETFLDACVVTVAADPGQTPVLDADGNTTTGPATTVYTGPCALADPRLATMRNRTLTDQAGVPDQRSLRLPVDSPDLPFGALVTMTASAFSPGLVGDEFVVIREDERSYATYRAHIVRGSTSDPT
jgi:hypothetical protein